MWLVGKDTTGKTGRVAISDELKAALVYRPGQRGRPPRFSLTCLDRSGEPQVDRLRLPWARAATAADERGLSQFSGNLLPPASYFAARPRARMPVSSAAGATAHPRDREGFALCYRPTKRPVQCSPEGTGEACTGEAGRDILHAGGATYAGGVPPQTIGFLQTEFQKA